MDRSEQVEVLNIHGRNTEEVCFGPFRFSTGNGLWRGNSEVPLPPRALAVLSALISRPGSVVSKQQLMDAVWKDAFVTEASLLEAVRVLRDALGDDRLRPTYVQTVHRRGYRFIAQVQAAGLAARGPDAGAEAPGPELLLFTADPERALAWGPHWRPLIAGATAAIVAMLGIAFIFALFGQRPQEARPTTRFTIALPDDTAIDPLRGSVAVSSDGTRMVYVALHGGRPRLFLRTIDRDAPEVIDGSDGAADPFFSPDGNWIGFFASGSLKKLRVNGGTAVTLCAARAGAGASWAPDGTIVFGGGPGGGLARVSADGGEPVLLAAPAGGSREVTYGWPDVLPDGSGVIYTAVSLAGSRIALYDTRAGTSRPLLAPGAFGRYSPTGHLVFERRGRLEAASFSLRDQRVTGLPRPILRGLSTSDAAHAGPRFAISRTGALIYVPGTSADVDDRLHWLDVRGHLEPVPVPAAPLGSVDVTPDLKQLAMAVETDAGVDLWIGDLQRGAVSRLSNDGGSASPAWRPDGLEIAFAYSKAGPFNLFVRPAHSDAAPKLLLESEWNQFPTSWSPDGRRLAFTEFHPLTGADIWTLDLVTRERRQVVRTLFDESHARFSPDGQWIAYMTNDSGRWDVFVRPASGAGPRIQVSTDGGAWPAWSIDGRTLYFSANGRAAAAAIQTSSPLTVSAPMLIAAPDDLQLASGRAASNRVLVRQGGAVPARHELRVVLEWFTELTRLVRRPA
jgi:Tol biopolymer transport system component/DNA-binding winged helix-turn-helix (wHTH) protein